jgi:hypothetical protein
MLEKMQVKLLLAEKSTGGGGGGDGSYGGDAELTARVAQLEGLIEQVQIMSRCVMLRYVMLWYAVCLLCVHFVLWF